MLASIAANYRWLVIIPCIVECCHCPADVERNLIERRPPHRAEAGQRAGGFLAECPGEKPSCAIGPAERPRRFACPSFTRPWVPWPAVLSTSGGTERLPSRE